MKNSQHLLLTLVICLSSLSAKALNVCTITVNSSDEKNVLQSYYKDASFKELVPDNKDPNWLDNACKAGVQCDVLLISGHFGGLFFGATSSSILSLDHLEELSCQNKCPGILNAKKVMLMGCNTLATKKPDHRSIEKYISVLVDDGFPQNLAEEVASSRYSDFGLSMAERMAVAFPKAESIYGFESTSPLGIENGPDLKRALENQEGSLDESMKLQFSGTSFKVIKPMNLISATTLKNSCGVRQTDQADKRQKTYEEILKMPKLNSFYDLLINNRDDEALGKAWENVGSEKIAQNLVDVSDKVIKKASIMIGLQLKVMKFLNNLGLMEDDDYVGSAYDLIQSRMRSGLDYIALDQLCSVAKELPELTFQSSWISSAKKTQLSYYAHLAGCFAQMDDQSKKKWADFSLNTNGNASLVRESLRTMKDLWTAEQKSKLNSKINSVSGSLKSELISSLGLKISDQATQSCLKSVTGSQAEARDDKRWDCFNRFSPSFSSIQVCQSAAVEFETEKGLGAHWHCLKNFPEDLSISNCIKAAKAVKNIEKSDDFLLGCWQQIKQISEDHSNSINRSECLRISESLQIYGNRIKQNWNCVSGLKE